jgi:NitT/TauT family transport system ATP-binding protein
VLLADRIIVMTPRPGRVREVIDVDLPRPRSIATLSDPKFNAFANHIRGQLFTRAVA